MSWRFPGDPEPQSFCLRVSADVDPALPLRRPLRRGSLLWTPFSQVVLKHIDCELATDKDRAGGRRYEPAPTQKMSAENRQNSRGPLAHRAFSAMLDKQRISTPSQFPAGRSRLGMGSDEKALRCLRTGTRPAGLFCPGIGLVHLEGHQDRLRSNASVNPRLRSHSPHYKQQPHQYQLDTRQSHTPPLQMTRHPITFLLEVTKHPFRPLRLVVELSLDLGEVL